MIHQSLYSHATICSLLCCSYVAFEADCLEAVHKQTTSLYVKPLHFLWWCWAAICLNTSASFQALYNKISNHRPSNNISSPEADDELNPRPANLHTILFYCLVQTPNYAMAEPANQPKRWSAKLHFVNNGG